MSGRERWTTELWVSCQLCFADNALTLLVLLRLQVECSYPQGGKRLQERQEVLVRCVGYLPRREPRSDPTENLTIVLLEVVEVDTAHHGMRDRKDRVASVGRYDA